MRALLQYTSTSMCEYRKALCAFLLDSSTASRGTMLESSSISLHFYAFRLCISMHFHCFLLTILFCFSTSFLYYALLLYSSTAWVLCYCVPAIAFQHYFILCVFPLRVLILFLATSIFSMRISIVLQHFLVRAFLLCSTFLLYSKTPRQKCGQEGPLNHFFLLCGGMFGLSRGLRHPQNRDPKNDFVLEGSKAQRGRLDGETPPPILQG